MQPENGPWKVNEVALVRHINPHNIDSDSTKLSWEYAPLCMKSRLSSGTTL